jgi:hypothetical protein
VKVSYASPYDCPRCGGPVRFTPPDKDEDAAMEECVAGCGPMPAVWDLGDIPMIVATVKRIRPILCPSCTRRRCDLCHASGCTCPGRHPRRSADAS